MGNSNSNNSSNKNNNNGPWNLGSTEVEEIFKKYSDKNRMHRADAIKFLEKYESKGRFTGPERAKLERFVDELIKEDEVGLDKTHFVELCLFFGAMTTDKSVKLSDSLQIKHNRLIIPPPPTAPIVQGEDKCHIWMVRHGARIDEDRTANDDWMNQHEWWDPPLTTKGMNQATEAGTNLKHRGIQFSNLYVSPLLRTAQTGAGISSELGMEIEILPGLSQCAAVVERIGLESMLLKLHSPASLQKHCPNIRIKSYQYIDESFSETAQRVGIPGKHVILVTHREGIYSALEWSKIYPLPRVNYCEIVHFTYDRNTKQWDKV